MRNESSILLAWLCPRWPPTTTWPTSLSLFINAGSVGHFTALCSFVRDLSSTHTGNLLDYVPSDVLHFLHISAKLNLHTRAKSAIMRLLPAAYSIFHLPLYPGWVYTRLPPWYLPCWPLFLQTSNPIAKLIQFYTIKAHSNIEGYLTVSPFLPMPSDEFITIHYTNSSCASHPTMFHYIIILLLYNGFQLLLIVAHAVCKG